MTIAEYIAARLAGIGVRYVFGIPGGPSIPYMEEFRSAGIEFVLTTGEAAAGIMADVASRLTGIPGVCHATFGPGATNLSTGVGCALLDRSPVIAFTSEMSDSMIRRTTQMNIDHQKLFEPLTKATFRINPVNVEFVMDSALRICRENYPGPVHIGLPADLAGEQFIKGSVIETFKGVMLPVNDTQKIISLLEKSRRPLIAAGLTAARLKLGSRIMEFLETCSMPVVITPMAKGLIPENHPCYAGVLFHSLSDYLEDIYEKTDLIIGIGYDPVEFNYESWIRDVPVLHFDTQEVDMPVKQNIVQYAGHPDEWFSLLNNLRKSSVIFEESLVRSVRDEMESVFRGFTSHFGPAAVLKILRDELPEDVILTCDVGSHLHLIGQFWKLNGKGKVIMTNGWSGMGFGIPSALSAQLHNRDATVVCITGDGGFLMMAGEMMTARRYNLPIIVVVFSDGELNLIKVKQSWKDLAPYGTSLYNGELFGAGSFLGIRVLNAGSQQEMTAAIIEALSLNEPVIINAVIDPDEYKWLIVKR